MSTPTKTAQEVVVIDKSLNKFNFINLFAYLTNAFVTFAIGTFGLAGRPTNSELSDKYQTIVTPSGSAFSIWSLIFVAQALWCVWQFLPSQRNSAGVTRVGYLYLLTVIAQCGWTVSFSYEIMWLSLVFMYLICLSLVTTVVRLQTYSKIWKGYFLWQFPFSIHCGWIIAASAVNTNVLPVFYEATAAVQFAVAGASLGVVTLVGLSWLCSYPVDLTVPIVLVWALTWLYLELNEPAESILLTFSQDQITAIQYTALAGLAVIAVGVVLKAIYVCAVQRPAAMKRKSETNTGATPAADEESQSA
jgi:benzodiazapine receptor